MASTSSIGMGSITFGGLATGMDTNSIIDKLVQIQSVPLMRLQNQQSACNTQISLLADLASRLNDLKAAASNLASSGAMSFQTTSTNDSFSAAPGTGASAGSFTVQVESLATAAKWRSGGLGPNDTLTPGTLRITVGGNVYPPESTDPITIDGTTTLQSLASAIRATGAPVSVNVLDDGTHQYLSITNLSTGYTGTQDDALRVVFDPTDPAATTSALSVPSLDHKADNATFYVDGLQYTRTSNTVSDAIPGTLLTLKSEGGSEETLSIGSDAAGTETNLQKFVDAYNGIMSAIQKQLNVGAGTDRNTTLVGDTNVRSLQAKLQAITSSIAYGQGTVHSLADLGVKTNRDGTLAIDSSALSAAIARDPVAVNAVFAQATTGVAARLSAIATDYSSDTGMLSAKQTSLKQKVSDLDDWAARLQARIDAYRAQLVAQYSAMENIVAKFKGIGDFLTAQENANKK